MQGQGQKRRGLRLLLPRAGRVLLILLALVIVLTAGLALLARHYSGTIRQLALQEINSRLQVPVDVASASVTVWSHFPLIALDLHSILTREETVYGSQPPLLKAESIYLLFNPIDILRARYRIHKIVLVDGELNLIIFWNGKDNFHFLREPEPGHSGQVDLRFDRVDVRRFSVTYRDLKTAQHHTFYLHEAGVAGSLNDQLFTARTRARARIGQLASGDQVFLQDLEMEADALLRVDIDLGEVTWQEGRIRAPGIRAATSGSILPGESGLNTDIQFTASGMAWKDIRSLLPEDVVVELDAYHPEGDLSLDMRISGEMGDEQLPAIRADWTWTDGAFRLCEEEEKSLKDILAQGHFNSGSQPGYAGMQLSITSLKATMDGRPLQASGTVSGSSPVIIRGNLRTEIRLSGLPTCWRSELPEGLDGMVALQLSGEINASALAGEGWIKAVHFRAEGALEKGVLPQEILGTELRSVRASFVADEIAWALKDMEAETDQGAVHADLRLTGWLARLSDPEQTLHCEAVIYAAGLPLEAWLKDDTATGNAEPLWPANATADIGLKVDHLKYREWEAAGLKGRLKLSKGGPLSWDLSLQTMGGDMALQGALAFSPGGHQLRCQAQLNAIDITEMFRQLEDFGQEDITHANLMGLLNARIDAGFLLDGNGQVSPASILATLDMEVKGGQILHYAPLEELSRFIRAGDLERVKIEPVRNQITIRDQRVIIPDMAVKTDAMDLQIAGVHHFDQSIDYSIRVLLSELLGRKAREARPENDEFGWVEDDGLGRTTLFIRVTGQASKPVFRYDKKEVVRKIGRDLRHERKELGKVFREEFHWLRKDSLERMQRKEEKERIKRQENGEFILEWDEDTLGGFGN